VSSFGASNRQVLDYLVDEVLRAHEPDVQDLMLRSSILDQLSGPSCDAILRRSGSARDLKELARTNLFLIPLDEHDEYYRFHHLFGQLLQVELQRRYSTEVPELHRRASAWLHGQGSTAAAVDHALEANDFDRAAEIIEGCWPEFSNAGQYATVLSWIRRLPPTFRRGDERLLLVEAWVLSFCGQQSAAAAALDEIGRLSARPGPLPDGFASIDSSVLTLRALLPWGDVGAQLANGLLACEAEPAESRWHACALWSVAAAHYFRGELPEADEWFDEAFTRAVVTGQWIIAASSLAYRSLIAGASADTANQALLASQSTELATGCGLDDVVGEVHSAAGASLAARGDLASALPLLARGVDVMRAWGQPTELIRSLVDLARVLVAAGDSGPAAAALDEARAIADTCTDPADLPRQIADLRRHVTSSGDRPGLTERETEIVELLRDGLSERQIADRLYISFNTVHTHVRSAYRKLGVASRPEALDRAVVLGVLDSDLT
jgi:LuxR family maltose regulon positive regulatory protein